MPVSGSVPVPRDDIFSCPGVVLHPHPRLTGVPGSQTEIGQVTVSAWASNPALGGLCAAVLTQGPRTTEGRRDLQKVLEADLVFALASL